MKCIICGTEMNSTTDGNYTCPICGKEDYYLADNRRTVAQRKEYII